MPPWVGFKLPTKEPCLEPGKRGGTFGTISPEVLVEAEARSPVWRDDLNNLSV